MPIEIENRNYLGKNRMKKLLLITALATPLLSGCIVAVSDGETEHGWSSSYNDSDWRGTHRENRKKISRLEIGEAYKDVLNKFSTPEYSELLKKGDSSYQVLYFATNSQHADGKVTKDECTPLVFKNAKLIGFGEKALAEIL